MSKRSFFCAAGVRLRVTKLAGKIKMQRGGSEIAETDGEIQFLNALDLQTDHSIFSVCLRVSALHFRGAVPTDCLRPEDESRPRGLSAVRRSVKQRRFRNNAIADDNNGKFESLV